MPDSRKIATCCYCGTRSVLVLDKARHELTCGACGAPLHDMKFMPKKAEKKEKRKSAAPVPSMPYPTTAPRDRGPVYQRPWQDDPRRKRKKKRKPMFRRMLEELWDEVEDIFD